MFYKVAFSNFQHSVCTLCIKKMIKWILNGYNYSFLSNHVHFTEEYEVTVLGIAAMVSVASKFLQDEVASQHTQPVLCPVFPSGPLSRYWMGSTLHNFGDQTGTGVSAQFDRNDKLRLFICTIYVTAFFFRFSDNSTR